MHRTTACARLGFGAMVLHALLSVGCDETSPDVSEAATCTLSVHMRVGWPEPIEEEVTWEGVHVMDEAGRVTQRRATSNIGDPRIENIEFSFDDQGRLLTYFGFDDQGRLLSYRDKTYVWREDGRLASSMSGDTLITYEYDDEHHTITALQNSRQSRRVYTLDPVTGAVVHSALFADEVSPNPRMSTVYEYDSAGRLLTTTERRWNEDEPHVLTHFYDDQGRLERVDEARFNRPAERLEAYIYNDEGDLVELRYGTSIDTYTWADGELVERRWNSAMVFTYNPSAPQACSVALGKPNRVELLPVRHHDGISQCLLHGRDRDLCTRGFVMSPYNEVIRAGLGALP